MYGTGALQTGKQYTHALYGHHFYEPLGWLHLSPGVEGCRCEPAAALQSSLAQLLLFAQLFLHSQSTCRSSCQICLGFSKLAPLPWKDQQLLSDYCMWGTSTYWVATVWEVFFIHQLVSPKVFCFLSLTVPSGYPVLAFTPCIEPGPGSCSLSLRPASFIHQLSWPSPHSTHFQSPLPSLHLDCHYNFSPGWKESLNQPSSIHRIPLHPILYWDPECFLKRWIRSVRPPTFLLWCLLLDSLWDTSLALWPHSHHMPSPS